MHILFDIDQTLVVHRKHVNKNYPHLTISKYINNYYVINLKKTSNLFKKLLKKNVSIGFLTAANYNKKFWLRIFEKTYRLRRHSLKNSVFINRHQYGNRYTPKGEKINKLIKDNLISGKIILVDDNKSHIRSAIKHGHGGILANGFPNDRKIDHSYLLEIEQCI